MDLHILMMRKLLLNPYQENEASQKGLADVTTLMAVYEWQEKTYLRYDNTKCSLKDSLICLYTMILSYEAALLVHLDQNAPNQWLDSIVSSGDWSSRLKDIREQDTKCRLITNAISAKLGVEWHEEEIKWQQDLLQQPRLAEESSHLRKLHSNYEAGKNVNPERVPGTCQWFLDHVDFLTWRKSQSSRLLWLSADPGCGKSVLAKYLVDRRGEALSVRKSKPTVCYFFFKDGDIERRDGAKAICALLHQLFLQHPQLYRHAKEDFRTKSDSFLIDLDALWNILIKAIEDSSEAEIICVLDALDECQEYSRKALIKKLVEFYGHEDTIKNSRPTVKFLVTSRPEIEIVRDFTDLTEVRLRGEEESEQISQEIDLVIQKRIQDIGKRMALRPSQQSSLRNKLTSIPHRTYLWLHLTFDAIEQKLLLTGKDIAAIVSVIPKNVDQAYTAILDRSRNKELARKLLHIVLAANEPLTIEELNVAIVLEEGQKCYSELDMWPKADSSDLVKNICGLFISVVDSKIYLIHQTAREFLLGEEQRGWRKSFRLAESNLILAKACIGLLLLQDFEENDLRPIDERSDYESENGSSESLPTSIQPAREDSTSVKSAKNAISVEEETRSENTSNEQLEEQATGPNQSDGDASSAEEMTDSDEDRPDTKSYILYEYAAFYWNDHFIEAGDLAGSNLIEIVAHRLFDTTSLCLRNWFYVFKGRPISWLMASPSFSFNLAAPSFFGLTAVVKLLLDQGSEVDLEDTSKRTPLHQAAIEGHAAVAELLLERGAKPDSADHKGYTSLHYAAQNSHEETAALLLKWGAEKDLKTHEQETPLHLATFRGTEGTVNMLVAKGVHIDPLNEDGKTPLALATRRGNDIVCKLLMTAGARTDLTDNYGNTLLHEAVYSDSTGLVQMVLDQGGQVNSRDHSGKTPLFYAARERNDTVVQLLLKAGARTDITDNDGATLLHHAAFGGNEAVSQTFLDQRLEVNFQDQKGQTPVLAAAKGGKNAVVQLLLKAGARTDIIDNEGQTVLHHAASGRNEAVVQIFLDQGHEVNFQDHEGQTALHCAARYANIAVPKMLLDVGARTDIIDNEGRTVLHHAARGGRKAVVQTFLDRGFEVNFQDHQGRTALFDAAEWGYSSAVEMLLERGARADLSDKEGRTPYSIAEERKKSKPWRREDYKYSNYSREVLLRVKACLRRQVQTL